jgi:hypothetical protein
MTSHEDQGTAYDSGAAGHERQGRAAAPNTIAGDYAGGGPMNPAGATGVKPLGERFQDAMLDAFGDRRVVRFADLPALAQARWNRAAVAFAARLSDARQILDDLRWDVAHDAFHEAVDPHVGEDGRVDLTDAWAAAQAAIISAYEATRP